MSDKLWLKDLPCYTPSEEYSKNGYFDLGLFSSEGVRNQVHAFLLDRASKYACSTLANERKAIRELAVFFSAAHPEISDLKDTEAGTIEKELKTFLLSNGEHIFKEVKSDIDNDTIRVRQSIVLLRALMDFIKAEGEADLPEEEKDIWTLANFPFPVMQNPVLMIKTVSFKKIKMEEVKAEIKKACFVRLHYNSVQTIQGMIREGRYLEEFLLKSYPEIVSLTELDRWVIEDYFLYRRTEETRRRFTCGGVSSLKSLLKEVGKIYEVPCLMNLILNLDYPKEPVRIYRAFSDEELERVHNAIKTLPKQKARCIFIHELLGTRISDTLTLKQDCLIQENGRWFVRIDQIKTGKSYRKLVNEEVVKLIRSSIAWTNEKYGDREYVFVKDADPDRPMPYSTIRYALKSCFHKNGVCDDNGNSIKAKTHTFRKTYGQKLTDMGADDEVIARLLGHTCKSSVRYYRKMSPKALAEATKEYREEIDRLIRKYKKDWGYE